MANRDVKHLLKRSNVNAKVPNLADLSRGELALNTADAKAYSIYTSGTTSDLEVRQLGWDRLSTESGGTVNGNVTITGSLEANTLITSGNTFDFLNFTTGKTSQPSYEEGKLYYNEDSKTINVYNDIDSTSLDIGRGNWTRVYNNSGSIIKKGKPVYTTGSLSGIPKVELAKADTLEKADLMGVAYNDINNQSEGEILSIGLIEGVNTSGFSEGDRVYVSDKTAGELTSISKPISAFIGIVQISDANNGSILLQDNKIRSTDNQVIIRSLDDLPPPDNNKKIQLQDNLIYRFNETVDIKDNTLVSGQDTALIGLNKQVDHIIYTGTGASIETRDSDVLIRELKLHASNGQIFDCKNTFGNEGINDFEMHDTVIHKTKDIGTFENLNVVEFHDIDVEETSNNGITLSGSSNSDFLFFDTLVRSFSGTFIDFGSSVWNAVHIDRCDIHVPSGSTFLSGLDNSGNIGPNNVNGKITNSNIFNEGGTNTSGITKDDLKWEFKLLNIEDSETIGTMLMQDNTTDTFIPSPQGTWVKVNGPTLEGNSLEGFSMPQDNRLQYNELNTRKLTVFATMHYEGGGEIIELTIFKNGAKVNNVKGEGLTGEGNPGSNTIIAPVTVSTGDYFELYIRSTTSSGFNVNIEHTQVQIS